MNHRKSLVASVLVMGLSGLAVTTGCQQPKILPPAVGGDPVPMANDPRIVAHDGLDGFIVASDPVVDREPGGLLRVSVPVRVIMDDGVIRVQYRFLYQDEKGLPLRPEEQWRYLVLPARTLVTMDSSAMSTRAVDWRLQIRSAR